MTRNPARKPLTCADTLVVGAVGGFVAACAASATWIARASRWRVFSLDQLGLHEPGHGLTPATVMVLGAEAYPDGRPSPMLAARLDLALATEAAGLAEDILVTGDAASGGLGESAAMANYLQVHGISPDRIRIDPVGVDTHASMINAAAAGIDRMYVVSQRFHLPRAVALARAAGIDAIGIADDATATVHPTEWAKGEIREVFAGLKAAVEAGTDAARAALRAR